jgi:hypothetical protein
VAAQAEGVRRFLLDQIVDDDLGPVQEVVIHDPNTVDAVSADLITEGREFRGICALSFATVVITPKADGPSTVEGIVCARLRLSLAGAMDLRNMLDKILKKSMPAKRETH